MQSPGPQCRRADSLGPELGRASSLWKEHEELSLVGTQCRKVFNKDGFTHSCRLEQSESASCWITWGHRANGSAWRKSRSNTIYPGNFQREIFNLVPRHHPISKGHCSLQTDWWNVDCSSNPLVSTHWVSAGWTTEWSRHNPLLRSWQSWEKRPWGGAEGSQSWEKGCESEKVEMCNNSDGPTMLWEYRRGLGIEEAAESC